MRSTDVLSKLKRTPAAALHHSRRLVDDMARRPVRAMRMAGFVVVALVAVAGLLGFLAHRYDELAAARLTAMAQADHSVVKLLSYNFRSIDHQVADTEHMLTGGFKAEYADLVSKTVAPTAKDKQVSVQTAVVENSVVSSDNDQMVLLMLLDQQSESMLKNDPVSSGSRVRVTLQREADSWLVSEITPV